MVWCDFPETFLPSPPVRYNVAPGDCISVPAADKSPVCTEMCNKEAFIPPVREG